MCQLSTYFLPVLLFWITASLIRTRLGQSFVFILRSRTMTVSESITGLRIGHLNVYHSFNKVGDVSLLMNQSSQLTHLFGISETHLDSRIDNDSIRIPEYLVIWRESSQTLHAGIALYVHESIAMNTRRRTDLESEGVECVWVEINDLKSPSLLVGYIYRNPASPTTWFDDFVLMIDKANDHKSSILLNGNFNIDLCKPQPTWDITTSLFGFQQLVRSATRITNYTATLTDHVYTNNQAMVSEVLVSTAGISDHSPVFCT